MYRQCHTKLQSPERDIYTVDMSDLQHVAILVIILTSVLLYKKFKHFTCNWHLYCYISVIVKLYSNFSERCLRMLEEEKYTDVTFLVEDQLFKAHRAILASRSDYFDR